jgi:hypothetical protein
MTHMKVEMPKGERREGKGKKKELLLSNVKQECYPLHKDIQFYHLVLTHSERRQL